jgi:glycosyltransferase involved in cell wall biosynthesis
VVVGELLQFDKAVVERLGISDRVRFAGRVELDDFQTWMIATDVVVNLRYPSAGESSGSLVRSLGAGKPTLVSRMPYCADHPLDLTIQIPVGGGEVVELQAALERLKSNPDFAAELGAAARAYARVRCTLEASAQAQAEFIYECMARRGLPVPTLDGLVHGLQGAAGAPTRR